MFKELLYKLKRPYHLVKTGLLNGLPAQIRFGFPARKLITTVITGTDGKTTSSSLLYHVLQVAGYKVGLISTVAAYIGSKEIDTGFHVTSPQPSQLQNFMRKMVENNFTHLVLEMTSHGHYQYRDWGISPTYAGLTNITHEHLDYHQTYLEYVKAKVGILQSAEIAIINKDDASFNKVRSLLNRSTTVGYSLQDQIPSKVKSAINKRFPEKYNQSNARLVYALALRIGVTDSAFIRAINSFKGVPGRMEFVPTQRPLKIIIDFAHTPNALKNLLTALRQQMIKAKTKGRLIAVGGSAGLRDHAKRPMMGKVATDLADLVVLTAEDPRTESVWSIIRQMKEQLTENHHKIVSVEDREEAINFAINKLAKKGDWIVVFGKGPEKSMCYGTTERPWSDLEAVKKALNNE